MRAIILSRLITVLGAAAAIAACEDSMSPSTPAGPTTAGITVIPSTATIHAGQLVTLQARIKDEFGDVLDGVSWKSSDDAIATVGSNGAVVGRMKGTVTVTASALGKAQSAVVHVLERESKDGGKGISKKGVPLLLRRNSLR
ncbi:MAG TPA: Ig-like domain-containing protein [Gemmatimonadales bacterium]|nr:Ig-like domain-containing protein [Gemmatimonadales bacterium]